MGSWYARFIMRHRWGVAAAALAVTAVMLSALIPPDRIRFDFSFRRLFRFEGEEARTLTHFRELFGEDAAAVVVLYVVGERGGERPEVLSPRVAASMLRLEEWVEGRVEIDGAATLSPLSATDFYAATLRSRALAKELRVLAGEVGDLGEVSAAYEEGRPLPAAGGEYEATAVRLASQQLYHGMLLSADGTAAALQTRFNLTHTHPAAHDGFLDELASRVEEEQAALGPGVTIRTNGIPVVTKEYTRLSIEDLIKTTPLSILMMTLFLFLLFRTAAGTLLPQAVVFVAVVWTLGFMQLTDEPLNIINHIVPTLVLVIGVSDAVHILSRYVEERKAGLGKKEAVQRTMKELSAAVFLTNITNAFGFGSLVTATIATISSFGVYSGIAMVFGYLVNIGVLPLVLSVTGPTTLGSLAHPKVDAFLDGLARWGVRRAKAIFAGSCLFMAGGLGLAWLVVGVDNHLLEEVPPSNGVYQSTKLLEARLTPVIPHEVLIEGRAHPERVCREEAECGEGQTCVRSASAAKALAPVKEAFRLLLSGEQMGVVERLESEMAEQASGATGVCVESVKDPRLLAAVDRVGEELLADPVAGRHVGRVEALPMVVRQMYQAMKREHEGSGRIPESRAAVSQLLVPIEASSQELLDRFTTLDYDAMRMSLHLLDHGSSGWYEVRAKLEEALARHVTSDPLLRDRFEVKITGTMTFVEKALSFIVSDLLSSFFTAFLAIFLIIMVVFRSVRVGLLLILPNVFPMAATLVLMALAGIDLRTSTILIFSVSIGIAVNDTIHYVSRFNEERRRGLSIDEAIVVTMSHTGRAMVISTVILCGGFLSGVISEFVGLQQFAYLASFTLFMALVGVMVIVPACLKLFAARDAGEVRQP